MLSTHEYITLYRTVINDFLGLELTVDGDHLKIDQSYVDRIGMEKVQLISILENANNMINLFYEDYKNLTPKPVHKLMFNEELAYHFIENGEALSRDALSLFVEKLKVICTMTYESQAAELGFIVIKEKAFDLGKGLDQLGIRYIPFDRPKSLEDLMKEKQTLKIVDSKSFSFVCDSDYKIIGLAQKRKNNSSITDIMLNRHNKSEESSVKSLAYNFYVELPLLSKINHEAFPEIERIEEGQAKMQAEIRECFRLEENEEITPNSLKHALANKGFTQQEMEELKEKVRKIYNSLTEYKYILQTNRQLFDRYKEDDATVNQLTDAMKHQIEMNALPLDFVYIKNKHIIWSSSREYVITYINGSWKMRNFYVLRSILVKFIMQQFPTIKDGMHITTKYIIDKINYVIPRAIFMYKMMIRLSEKNIGSLICLLGKTKENKNSLFKKMLQKGVLSPGYEKIVRTDANRYLNIMSCDPYYFELIASVDGAVILDQHLNILSYGEMIRSIGINDANDGLISGESSVAQETIYRGARTLAAQSSSDFGLSIKVSEDGDISIFENMKELARI